MLSLMSFLPRENRWRKRGLAMTPTKFGISFTATFMNQVRKQTPCFHTAVVALDRTEPRFPVVIFV